jgi:hypothetical protein
MVLANSFLFIGNDFWHCGDGDRVMTHRATRRGIRGGRSPRIGNRDGRRWGVRTYQENGYLITWPATAMTLGRQTQPVE